MMFVLGVVSGLVVPGAAALFLFLLVGFAYEVGLSRARSAGTDRSQLGFPWVFRLGLLAFLVILSWPFERFARMNVSVEAAQAMLLAFVIPALIVAGGPWQAFAHLGPIAKVVERRSPRAQELAARRSAARLAALKAGKGQQFPGEGQRSGSRSSWLRLGVFVLAVISWHTPAGVNAVRAHLYFLALEVVILIGAGIALWLELIASGSHSPQAPRPLRMAMAAISMWSTWIVAYVLGFSSHPWFHAYLTANGRDLSAVVDQEISAALLFVISAAALGPVVFLNLTRWLRSEDDIDDALYAALREEASRVQEGRTP